MIRPPHVTPGLRPRPEDGHVALMRVIIDTLREAGPTLSLRGPGNKKYGPRVRQSNYKMTFEKAETLRARRREHGTSTAALAVEFGVGITCVKRIIRGDAWSVPPSGQAPA